MEIVSVVIIDLNFLDFRCIECTGWLGPVPSLRNVLADMVRGCSEKVRQRWAFILNNANECPMIF